VQPAAPAGPTEAEVLNQARREAAQILQEAAEEAERAQEEARRQGFARGREEGLAAGRAEVEMLRQKAELELENARLQGENRLKEAEAAAAATLAEAEKKAQSIIAAAEEEARQIRERAEADAWRHAEEWSEALVDLAVAAAQRIVQGHLALQPESIARMVAAGLRRLRDSHCAVRIGPEDLPLLEAQRSMLERELGAGTLTFITDPSLSPGSYMISSPQGQIDGRLEQQTERIRAALKAALGGEQP